MSQAASYSREEEASITVETLAASQSRSETSVKSEAGAAEQSAPILWPCPTMRRMVSGSQVCRRRLRRRQP